MAKGKGAATASEENNVQVTPNGDAVFVPQPTAPVVNVQQAAPVESKADKFKRLGSRRVAKAIKAMQQIKALANRSQYDFSSEQVAKITAALNESVKQIINAFTGQKKKAETFDL